MYIRMYIQHVNYVHSFVSTINITGTGNLYLNSTKVQIKCQHNTKAYTYIRKYTHTKIVRTYVHSMSHNTD